ncbi:Hypothetical_protein [Hexamita inflata]|uniref:Hypothetical_protein n=1 Tax=Hexamita inflata TaxID=28002 RepID=A0AA86QRT7_9EUKA|nr:Hypothetical protein HINF_LOCUS49542 [Hexamita inflata]
MSPQFIVVAVLFITNSLTRWLCQVDLLIKMSFHELSSDNHSSRHNKHIQITTSMTNSVALSLRNGNIFCLKSCTQVTGQLYKQPRKIKWFTRSASGSKQNRLDLTSGHECVYVETNETQKSLEGKVQ